MLLFELWIRYYIFIRRLYKNVDNRENVSSIISSLAFISIIIILFFFTTLFSYIYNYQGITYVFSKGLPLSVIAMAGSTILFYYLYKNVSRKAKIKLFRRCLKNNDSRNILYPIVYVVIITVMFFASLVLMLMNIP